MSEARQVFIIRKDDSIRLGNAVRALTALSKTIDIEVAIHDWKPKRSSSQLNTFWWWADYCAKYFREAGIACSADPHIHDAVLGGHFGWIETPWGGRYPARSLTRPKRPNKAEMIEIMNAFGAWAADQGIVLPEPVTELTR